MADGERARVELVCSLPADAVAYAASGFEAANRLSRWEVRVICQSADVDLDALIGTPATLKLQDDWEATERHIDLVIVDATYQREQRDGHHFAIGLSEAEYVCTLRSGYRVFNDKGTKDIVTKVLTDAGIPADKLVWRLKGTWYLERKYCVQYDEPEWFFIERLLADEGITYWFDRVGDDTKIVFGDDPGSHEGISGHAALLFAEAAGMVAYRHFDELEVTERLTTTKVHVREYDVRAPKVFIEGKAGQGPRQYFEYPAAVLTADAAAARAKVRLQQLTRYEKEAVGRSDCVRIQPGRIVDIEGAEDGLSGKYLVTQVQHTWVGQDTRIGDAKQHEYRNHVVMVPVGEAAFRPDLPHGVPKVSGIEMALTTGPSGEEIHVDDLGRLKLRFPWDRSGIMDDKSSYWVRSLQMAMGMSMLLPRVGWEVPVAYLDGDPDRPFVLGRLYNASAVLPYDLPGHGPTTSLQSATSPGGGSTNEVRMGDSGGSQEVFIHASKDQSVTVGGSADTTVSANMTHDVGLALKVGIHASQTLSVGASQSVNVGTDYVVEVGGGRTEMVGAMESIKLTANRYLGIKGSYSELVGALYGLQCNQSNLTVKAAFTQLVGSGMGLTCGLGASESVSAARTEIVGGGQSFTIGSGMGESVKGAKTLTAGANNEKAGGGHSTDVKAAGTISVGGSAKIVAGGDFTMKAPTITIDVSGDITAKDVKIGGGKVKVSCKATLKGSVKRSAGSETGG